MELESQQRFLDVPEFLTTLQRKLPEMLSTPHMPIPFSHAARQTYTLEYRPQQSSAEEATISMTVGK